MAEKPIIIIRKAGIPVPLNSYDPHRLKNKIINYASLVYKLYYKISMERPFAELEKVAVGKNHTHFFPQYGRSRSRRVTECATKNFPLISQWEPERFGVERSLPINFVFGVKRFLE